MRGASMLAIHLIASNAAEVSRHNLNSSGDWTGPTPAAGAAGAARQLAGHAAPWLALEAPAAAPAPVGGKQ